MIPPVKMINNILAQIIFIFYANSTFYVKMLGKIRDRKENKYGTKSDCNI